MSNIDKRVTEALKIIGVKAGVSIQRSRMLGKKPRLHITVENVSSEEDLQLSADIQRVLRTTVGYGMTTTEYNPHKRTLVLDYAGIPEERPVKSETRISNERPRYRAAGSTQTF